MRHTLNSASSHHRKEPDGGLALWRRMSVALKNTIVNAQQQCLQQESPSLDASHVFAGLLMLDLSSSNGLRLLEELGVDVTALASSLRGSGFISAPGEWPPRTKPQSYAADLDVSPEFNALMQEAGVVATSLGHERIGTEHLVLAFLTMPGTHGFRVLNGFGVTLEAARERLGRWLVDGTYAQELAMPGQTHVGDAGGRGDRPGAVYTVYRVSRIGYFLTIFIPLLFDFLVPGRHFLPLDRYLAVMDVPISIYMFPYVLSIYALFYLLRSRALKKLQQVPPARSMVGLALPFSLSAASGVLLLLATAPMVLTLPRLDKLLTIHGGTDVIAYFFCCLLTLNCFAAVVSHWLLTFNIKGNTLPMWE